MADMTKWKYFFFFELRISLVNNTHLRSFYTIKIIYVFDKIGHLVRYRLISYFQFSVLFSLLL